LVSGLVLGVRVRVRTRVRVRVRVRVTVIVIDKNPSGTHRWINVESMLNLGLDVDQLLFNIDSTLVFHRCNCNVVSTLNLDYVEMLTLDQC